MGAYCGVGLTSWPCLHPTLPCPHHHTHLQSSTSLDLIPNPPCARPTTTTTAAAAMAFLNQPPARPPTRCIVADAMPNMERGIARIVDAPLANHSDPNITGCRGVTNCSHAKAHAFAKIDGTWRARGPTIHVCTARGQPARGFIRARPRKSVTQGSW